MRSSLVIAACLLAGNCPAQDDGQQQQQAGPATSALGQAIAQDQRDKEVGKEPAKTVVDEFHETYIGPDDRARVAYLPPQGATAISKEGRLWVDAKKRCVFLDGYVAMRDGALEMFACPVGTKEHESIVAALAKSREVHAALLAVKAKPGSPVRFLPQFEQPTGDAIRVWVCWRDSGDKFKVVDARRWVQRNGDFENHMKAEWVFGGSGFWKDPADGREYYRADGGDMICVSNFTTAMMDVNISSSAEAGELQYVPFVDRIPPRGTPVRLVLCPTNSKASSTKVKDPALSEQPVKPVAKKQPSIYSEKAPAKDVLPSNPDSEAALKAILKKRAQEEE